MVIQAVENKKKPLEIAVTSASVSVPKLPQRTLGKSQLKKIPPFSEAEMWSGQMYKRPVPIITRLSPAYTPGLTS